MTRKRRGAEDDFLPATTEPFSIIQQCAWKTMGLRCQMLATIWTHPTGNYEFDKFGNVTKVIRPGYCGWHYECLLSPRLADDFEEFERLQVYWLRRPYCNQFVHHPADYVFDALHGCYREMHERLTVTPCDAQDCWVPDVLGLEPPGPPIGEREARTRIREIVRALAEKMDAKEPR